MRLATLILALLTLSACVPKNVQVVQPLPDELLGQLDVQNVTVSYSQLAQDRIQKIDLERKVEGEKSSEPELVSYKPLSTVLADITKNRLEQRDEDSQRFVDIKIEIDNLKLVNPVAAVLIGDVDQLSGSVKAVDSATGETVTECYVDVINGSGGLLGLAIRGAGAREKISAQFSDFIGDHLGYKKLDVR